MDQDVILKKLELLNRQKQILEEAITRQKLKEQIEESHQLEQLKNNAVLQENHQIKNQTDTFLNLQA